MVPESLDSAIYMQWLPFLPLMQVCSTPLEVNRLLVGCAAWHVQVCSQTVSVISCSCNAGHWPLNLKMTFIDFSALCAFFTTSQVTQSLLQCQPLWVNAMHYSAIISAAKTPVCASSLPPGPPCLVPFSTLVALQQSMAEVLRYLLAACELM